jgi:hypothetical protein
MFKSGEIVFAGTNEEHERLGERLVRAGMIKRSILDLTFRVMERSHLRMGKTIVEWGWVSPWEMQRCLAEQIKDIIGSLFTWTSGQYRFEPLHQPVEPDLLMEIKTAEVIWEGVQRISARDAIRIGVGDPRGVLELAEGDRLGIPVGQNEGYILARSDGGSSISQIVADSPLGEEETLRCIYALLLAGVVIRKDVPATNEVPTNPDEAGLFYEQSTRGKDTKKEESTFRDSLVARHAAMQFGNLYDRLGVDIRASTERIREAYQEVMKSLEPQPHFRDRIEDLWSRLEKVRKKVTEAYSILTDPVQRSAYDRSIDGPSPEATLAPEASPEEQAPMEKTIAESSKT